MYRLTPWLFLFLSLSFPLWAAEGGQKDSRPNFVIIILDDWGWRESGAYGNPRIQTPHIDQLARDGVKFNNAFLAASTCASSRASILTGLYPFAAGVPRLHVPMPADRKLLSQYLRQAGYFTASIGKWHLGEAVKNQFDLVIEERSLDKRQTGMEDWLPTLTQRLPPHRPFFLWLAAKDAHRPWFREPEWAVHKAESMEIPAYIEFTPNHSESVIRQEMALYYDEIHRADFYIGQVIDTLKQQKLLDNTVVMVMSDNGSPFWRAKKFLTDPGLKTPFIVYWPKQPRQHHEINELVSAVDIAPTLLQLAGVEVPGQMEGYSFARWLTEADSAITPIRPFVYGERGDGLLGSENGRSIRDRDYLYIVDDLDTYTHCDDESKRHIFRREALFDVKADPDDIHNLATSPNYFQQLFGRLRGEKDYTPVLQHYRQLLEQRRKERDDLPRPTIDGPCPILWWQETQAPQNNPDSEDD